MAGGNLSPRQKMINMMYLVLTALLALNVSKDILKAFQKVEGSLSQAVENIGIQNNLMYSEFQKAADNNPLKVGMWKDLAFDIKDEATGLRMYIGELKDSLITKTGGYDEDGALIGMDNLEKVANEMLKKPKKGALLKAEIEKYRDSMLSIEGVSDNEDLTSLIISTFNIDDIIIKNQPVLWEEDRFSHYPLIAVLTFLTQIQGDVVNIESKVVDYLRSNIGADDMKFSTVAAQVISPKNYVMEGDSFKATISIAAYDDSQTPTIIVTDVFIGDTLPDYSFADTIPVSLDGRGMYSIPARGIGVQKRAAKILLTTESGIKEYEEIFEYQVAKPMAVVSPTKMNVFYRGVPNPIEISVPGYSPEDLTVSGTNVTLKRIKPGQYEATVRDKAKGDSKITVKANGRTIGKPIEFRLKRIPSPSASINGKKEGVMSKGKLSKAQGIAATLPQFPFDLKYTVESYDVRLTDGEYTKTIKVKGNKFTAEVKEKILKLKPGSDISFTNIRAKGPDGRKPCGAIILTVQ
jgi:gliding motility-associated protein GldM